MGGPRPRPLVLDSGALIQVDRGDARLRAVLRRAHEHRAMVVIPAGALAEAWRNGSRQARLATLVNDAMATVAILDELAAKAAGALCGRAGTSDIVDASVVIAARAVGGVVLTGDTRDLRKLDSGVPLEAV